MDYAAVWLLRLSILLNEATAAVDGTTMTHSPVFATLPWVNLHLEHQIRLKSGPVLS